jgi:glycosyltransferase involved in cell wall biosynthesis
MRVLVWQWGRHGAGPHYAASLAAALRQVPGTEALLSLSRGAEIMAGPDAPPCALPVSTYAGVAGLLWRVMTAPFALLPLVRRLRRLRPDVALCAMTAPLDLLMAWALRLAGIPFVVAVHDATVHPGDGFPLQMMLQTMLVRRADALMALSGHVARLLEAQGLVRGRQLIMTSLPPFVFGPPPAAPGAHNGKRRLLCFGRLLPYKGLDLLEEALRLIAERYQGEVPAFEVRIAGSGPESATLDALRRLPGVQVKNRWVPDAEVGGMLAWADVLVLSHREASQSGVAAAAIAAGRWVVATRVGGLAEQLADEKLARLCDTTGPSLAAALEALLPALPPWPGGADPVAAWRRVATDMVQQLGAAREIA